MSANETQNSEIEVIKSQLRARRAAGGKGPYPAGVRDSVLRLRREGVPLSVLSQRLGISTSILHSWSKKSVALEARSTQPRPSIMEVKPQVATTRDGADELCLQVGLFQVTIRLQEV